VFKSGFSKVQPQKTLGFEGFNWDLIGVWPAKWDCDILMRTSG
jgi:hypothetical protein